MKRLLSKKKVCEKLSVSHATIARWEADPVLQFPKRFHIGGEGSWRKAFWREDEVDEWIERQTLRDNPSTAPA